MYLFDCDGVILASVGFYLVAAILGFSWFNFMSFSLL